MRTFKPLLLCLIGVLLLSTTTSTFAGDFTLSNNSGSASTIWFISGEASLVMNRFDLAARNVTLPTQLDRASISVETPIPGTLIDVVVFEDADGDSPANAELVGRTEVDIRSAGTFTVTFDDPLNINQPFVWVGFYLPVDFEFRADTSGTSSLTYWAWVSGSRFDPGNLSTAGVLGPANGSSPVGIDMDGVARITAELITDGTATALSETTTNNDITGVSPITRSNDTDLVNVNAAVFPNRNAAGRIIQNDGGQADLRAMQGYADCDGLFYDTYDTEVTYGSGVRMACKSWPQQLMPETPEGYVRRTQVGYDMDIYGVDSGLTSFPESVTHCMVVPNADLPNAVLGVAQGSLRFWTILPTVRYGDAICSEFDQAGWIAYFLPTS